MRMPIAGLLQLAPKQHHPLMNLHANSVRCLLALALPSAAVCAQPASASTVEERLIRLENQLARIEARLGDTVASAELAPTLKEFADLTRNLGWDGKSPLTVAKAGGKEQKLSIGGFVHTHAEFGQAPDSRYAGINNRVLLRRARITTKGSFADGFEFTVQPDFGNNWRAQG
jgi:hypothetical protein